MRAKSTPKGNQKSYVSCLPAPNLTPYLSLRRFGGAIFVLYRICPIYADAVVVKKLPNLLRYTPKNTNGITHT